MLIATRAHLHHANVPAAEPAVGIKRGLRLFFVAKITNKEIGGLEQDLAWDTILLYVLSIRIREAQLGPGKKGAGRPVPHVMRACQSCNDARFS